MVDTPTPGDKEIISSSAVALPKIPEKKFVPPAAGEAITSLLTNNTYVIVTGTRDSDRGQC